MLIDITLGPVKAPAKFERFGQAACLKVGIDRRARATAKLGTEFCQGQISLHFAPSLFDSEWCKGDALCLN